MIRTFKYRLYPRRSELERLDFLLDQARSIYNAALEQRINVYKTTGKGVTYPEQWAHFRDIRRENPDTLGQLNATSIQQLLRRLDKAFRAFFRRIKAGGTPGFPRFKAANRFRSLEFRHGDGCKLKPGKQTTLYVQNVGNIKVKFHRDLPAGSAIKHVVIKRSLGKWYVCLQVEVPETSIPEHQGSPIGIDMGIKFLLAFSDGRLIDNPRWLRSSQDRLRVAQRRLSRRKKGSRRWRKAAFEVAKIHEHIKNQRLDFWHKTTRSVADNHSIIGVEDLHLSFMTSNRSLALSAHDAGLALFTRLLAYKAEEAGARVISVNPANTSQACSGCGVIVPKILSVRLHQCTSCGLALDRDVNAARNILALALQPARTGRSGLNVGQQAMRAPRSSLL